MKKLLNAFQATMGISSFIFDNRWELISSTSKWEARMKNFFFLNCQYDLTRLKADSEEAYFFTDRFALAWIVQPDPRMRSFIVLGPVFDTEFDSASFQRRMEFRDMPVSSKLAFLKMLDDIPVLSTMRFMDISRILHFYLCEKTEDPHLLSSKLRTEENENKEFIEPSLSHGSRYHEKTMLRNVREGNIEDNSFLSDNTKGPIHVGRLSKDSLRQAKNLIICQTALVTRAAVDGGLDAEKAYSLSDIFIQKIESCKRAEDVYGFSEQVYKTFTQMVHDAKVKSLSPLVQYMMTYTEKHLHEAIDLKDPANATGYEPYYMTSVFRKETGTTIDEFILKKKVEMARILLETTGDSILDISYELGFSSPSYFSARFKKVTGESPATFRKHHQNKN